VSPRGGKLTQVLGRPREHLGTRCLRVAVANRAERVHRQHRGHRSGMLTAAWNTKWPPHEWPIR